MFGERGISMNELEKRSFYSFLTLYLLSSALFIVLLGYWYYTSQKNALENETYYKLTHFADSLSASIISAQMKGTTLTLPNDTQFEYKLIPLTEAQQFQEGYFEQNGYKVLISSAPQEHLGIKYVLVKTNSYFQQLHTLQKTVLWVMELSFGIIGIISYFLAKLFMKPLHYRVLQIEDFLRDLTHELNTPITALKMSASRALKKEVYDKKILTNISISTKQLESIYKSLTFLNFKTKMQEDEQLNLKNILEEVISFYKELLDGKQITLQTHLEDVERTISPTKAYLLFSNLLSNAIKYSMPSSTITLTLNKEQFIIQDEGMGIEQEKLEKIFALYERSSDVAGGFGVGLSIVKQICDEYNIAITVDSKPQKGTTFRLDF